jgi:hypothetical protein
MTNKVQIQGLNGPVDYVLLKDRRPEFVKAYPLTHEGYSIETTFEFLEQAAPQHDSRRSTEVPGAPPLVIFKTTLRDKSGRTIANAHALQVIREEKDFEIGETAAEQRLYARLGYGGDMFDEPLKVFKASLNAATVPADAPPLVTSGQQTTPAAGRPRYAPPVSSPPGAEEDIPDAGLPPVQVHSTSPEAEAPPASAPASTEAPPPPATVATEAEGDSSVSGSDSGAEAEALTPSDASAPKSRTAKGAQQSIDAQLATFRRNIETVSKRLGETPPQVTSLDEAKQVYRDLARRQKQK